MALIDDLISRLDDAKRIASAIKDSEVITVRSGENLQSAIDKGGNIVCENGAIFSADKFIFSEPIKLSGKCYLVGKSGPAIYVPPGSHDINISDVKCQANYGSAIQLGDNDITQIKLEQVPTRINLTGVSVPTHNGKRALEINSSATQIIDCEFLDVWDKSSSNSDSHPWAILNTPGGIIIQGGRHSGGSELGLIGGDFMKIPNVRPTDIIIRDLLLFRPLNWFTDGIDRKYKCGLELKTGDNVLIQRVTIDGNMKSAQPDAFALQLTPRSGGAITNVLVEDLTVNNSPSFCGITSFDNVNIPANPIRTTGIVMRSCKITLDKTTYKGAGRVFLLQGDIIKGGIGTLDISEFDVTNPGGNAFIYSDAAKIDSTTVKNSRSNIGTYGISLGGNHWGNLWKNVVADLVVESNTFSESNSTFRKNFPINTYI